ncbi:MAG: FAD-binding oxidoreductase, partial [Planctomycetes bacterium]|nr:FAD-binding oxidoreductase [Planctomycetota bacterium]
MDPAPARFPRLDGDLQTDVAIIGGGITGLTAALHLKKAGRRVVVLEAGRIAAGTSSGTSGHLETLPDSGLERLISNFGEEAARQIVTARLAAIDQIETWSRDYRIDCDFARVPAFVYSESESGRRELEPEREAAARVGLKASAASAIPLPFKTAGGFRVEDQGRFHSVRYLAGLAAAVNGDGSAVCEHTRAQPPEDGDPCTIQTDAGCVKANHVIVATHSGFLGVSQLDTRVAPYQSYVMTVRIAKNVPDALYWDDAEPYHYIRLAPGASPDQLIVGGADHKTGHGDGRSSYEDLERYIRERFEVRAIEHRWSAELFEPADGVPLIGRAFGWKHVYVATGYSGSGLTWGTVGGRVLADLLLDQDNPLAEVVTPSLVNPIASAKRFLSQNQDVARHYVGDRLTLQTIESQSLFAPGQGR